MNLLLIETTLVAFVLLLNCNQAKPTEPSGNKTSTRSRNKNMKAFLMQCSENVDASLKNIHVTIQIGEHIMTKTLAKTNNDSFVGRILIGEMSNANEIFAYDLRTPSLVEVSNEDFVLMYPFQLETLKTEVHTLDTIPKKGSSLKADSYEGLKNAEYSNHLNEIKDVHNANNVKLLDDVYSTRLKPSDFLKRSDFMHTNPKDFRRDSICTKNFRKDNNKNNANNEYANEEFYGDKNQRENENAFSGKFGIYLNNNEIDNFKSDKKNAFKNIIINDIGYFTKNLVDDKDSRKRRKNEHKNDFIKCVGMKNFKKIDHVLCTCARNVDEVNEDETENDERSNCLQLINNVCLWGPVYNKNINYEMKMNQVRRNGYYGNIKSTAFACCDLLPPFYLALGSRCYSRFMEEDDYDDLYDEKDQRWPDITKSGFLDSWPEIIKAKSDEILDRTTSFIHSNIEKNTNKNSFVGSNLKSLNLYSDNKYKNEQARNRINNERFKNLESVPLYDNNDDINEIPDKPIKHRKFNLRDTMPFDKVIYDPHLNIADKMQLINMISPKRPCESNRLNHHTSYHDHRQKRESGIFEEFSLTDDEIDAALNDYEFQYPDSKEYSAMDERRKFSNDGNVTTNNEEKSVRKMQTICSQHPCALAMPFKKDPYFRGEMKFFDNDGSSLRSKQIAENICRDHFNEFILIPFENTNGTN